MRRRLAVLAAVPLLFAAACGGSTDAGGLKVAGAAGAEPQVTFPTGDPAAKSSYQVLNAGSGAALAKGDTVFVNLTVWTWDGKDNKKEGTTYTAKKPEPIQISDNMPKVMVDGFAKTKLGGRFMAVVAQDSYTKEEQENAKKQGTDTSKPKVFVIDPVSTLPKAAVGTATDPGVKGVKVENPGGTEAPKLTTKTDEKAPKEFVNKTIIKGTGPAVKKGQSAVVHYTGKIWGTDKQFDSSWGGEPFTVQGIGTAEVQVIKGWDQALNGATVGSRLLLVIPPELGYGAQANGGIPANSTLVFTVDVLAAY
ncbi:FKBP-type peptidyl-prolyl cis-trans isomerase [Nonomuraea sp. NPDC050556]|uniref:FKBP-type peptidyl-prolyl cis-trans isomerase n=1 Tax=Nonomuraea sp. NPDC050556 TaxID=3364369 RepID=UPI00378BCCAA